MSTIITRFSRQLQILLVFTLDASKITFKCFEVRLKPYLGLVFILSDFCLEWNVHMQIIWIFSNKSKLVIFRQYIFLHDNFFHIFANFSQPLVRSRLFINFKLESAFLLGDGANFVLVPQFALFAFFKCERQIRSARRTRCSSQPDRNILCLVQNLIEHCCSN